MNSETLIKLNNVGVKFSKRKSLLKAKKSSDFWALKGISFEVKKGEVLGVIGKNGAGKSTLLTILAGIISPSTGSIEFNTQSVSLLSLSAGFVKFLSGRKNIILSGMLMGFTKTQMLEKMDDIINFADIGDFIDKPVVTYSTGMKTRLGFATALNIDPDIILIDEVLGVGDAAFKEKSSKALKDKFITGDKTAIIVSHSESTIRDLCDRIVWINRGEVQDISEVDSAMNKYNNFLKKK